jgi:protein ImuA
LLQVDGWRKRAQSSNILVIYTVKYCLLQLLANWILLVFSFSSLPFQSFGKAVWQANQLETLGGATVATGFPVLDFQLPGGGWPVGAVSEILQAQNDQHEWRLLLPALRRTKDGPVVLVGPPHMPFGPGLAAQDFDAQRLLLVATATPTNRLWAIEQALRCSAVSAVLAWLPQVRPEQLRRLQITAHTHNKLLFVMRPAQTRTESSPSLLRVMTTTQTGSEALLLHILKRRGPPLDQPLPLLATVSMATLMSLVRNHDALDSPSTDA